MKYTVLRKTFSELLTKAGPFTSYKIGDIESLRGIYIEAKSDGVVVHTTNITDYFRGECGGKVEKTGVCLVDYKTISDVVRNLIDENIVCEVNQNQFTIKTKKTEANIPLLDSRTFPQEEKFPLEDAKKIPLDMVLPEEMDLVLLSAATDETRPILTGILYEFGKGVSIVSTDGFRLSLLHKETDTPLEISFVIPSRSITNIVKTVSKNRIKSISVSHDLKRVFWISEGVLIATRTIDGEYPPYKRVIPPVGTSQIVMDRKDLERAIKTVALFSKEGSSLVLFSIQGNSLVLSSPRSSSGSAKVVLELDKKEGNENEITFNCKYIQALISHTEHQQISFEMTDATLPGVFRLDGKDDYVHIIMPIRPQ